MALLPIITDSNDPVLHTKTEEVPQVTKDVKKLIKDMYETVEQANGAGLAGPQVGVLKRVCLAIINKKMVALINPHITWRSEETDIDEEGCLSLPGIWKKVERPTSILLEFVDLNGDKQERKLSGFDARVVQHEVDHLEGILILDH